MLGYNKWDMVVTSGIHLNIMLTTTLWALCGWCNSSNNYLKIVMTSRIVWRSKAHTVIC